MLIIILNIILVVAAVLGMYMLSNHDKNGFIVFFVLEFVSIYLGIDSHNYGMCIAAIFYLIMNAYSYIKWSQTEKKYENRK